MASCLRTFCVIPHMVRDNEAFEAVHEDHIVYDAQGKLLSFDFSAVLSPAHNLSQNILGPIFDAVRNRQHAALLVCTPGGSGEASTVSMDLFANALPLLFRAVPSCAIAHLSLVEVKKDGKSLTDLYRTTRVSTPQELDVEEVLRASSPAAWGTVMELIAQRGSWTNDGETAVLCIVRLEGHGTLIVGDIGCSSELLSFLTLTIRSNESFGSSRTISPRVAFSRILQDVSSSAESQTHVVVVPDPSANATHTLRMLHFASNLTKDSTTLGDGRRSSHDDDEGIDERNLFLISHEEGTRSSARFTPASTKMEYRPATATTSNSRRHGNTTGASGSQHHTSVPHSSATHSWRDEIVHGLLNASSGNSTIVAHPSSSSMSSPNTNRGGAVPTGPISSSSMMVITPSQREQQLSTKLLALDKTNKNQKQQIAALQNELRRAQHELDASRADAEEKSRLAQSHEETARTCRQEQQDAADLVATLLKRIGDMEKTSATTVGSTQELKLRNDELQRMNGTLQEQLARTAQKLRMLEKKEVSRLRDSTLAHISPARSSKKPPQQPSSAAGSKVAGSASKSYVPSSTTQDAEDDSGNWDSNSLLHSIKQLRVRCSKLEGENHDLRLRHQQEEAFLRAMSLVESGGGTPRTGHTPKGRKRTEQEETAQPQNESLGGGSPHRVAGGTNRVSQYLEKECALLRQQVQHVSDEMLRVQKDKDQLQEMLTAHPRSVDVSDAVKAVAAAIASGCSSLLVQLQVVGSSSAATTVTAGRAAMVSPQSRGSYASSSAVDGQTKSLIAQHTQAIQSLKTAIEEIISRRCTVSRGGIPTTATATDCDTLAHFLTFEVERLTHLRAFIPSFAQLCVAVEHLKLRSAAGTPTTVKRSSQ